MRHKPTLTVLLVASSAIVLTSCANYDAMELSGHTGVSHDGNGNLSLHVNTCENSTTRVDVVAGREGLADDEENPSIGSFTLDAPASGSLVVRVQNPSPWSVDQQLDLPGNFSHFFIVSALTEDNGGPRFINPQKYFSDAALTYDRLMAAPPGTVVIGLNNGLTSVTKEQFDATCPSGGYPTTDEIDTTAVVQSFGDRMVGFQGGVLLCSFKSNAVLDGNWHLYSALETPGPAGTTAPVKRELITKEDVERMESEIRPLATRDCPSEALHPSTFQEYNCVRAVYIAGKGVWVPFRRGRTHGETGTGGFGINHAFHDHNFNIHWAERILQSSADYNLVDISYDPVTQRSKYMWKTGAEFSVMSGGKRHYIEAIEVIVEPGPPGTVQVPIDNASMGLITGFCRQKDRNGTVLPKCPEDNMPGPFRRTEYSTYDWEMGG